MGVYISGLEIPPKGKGAVVILCSSGAVYSGGQKVGTAVPVPPHGRLGDLDEIERYKERLVVDADKIKNGIRYVVDTKYIKEAPTIIPAEEAGQDARDGT